MKRISMLITVLVCATTSDTMAMESAMAAKHMNTLITTTNGSSTGKTVTSPEAQRKLLDEARRQLEEACRQAQHEANHAIYRLHLMALLRSRL